MPSRILAKPLNSYHYRPLSSDVFNCLRTSGDYSNGTRNSSSSSSPKQRGPNFPRLERRHPARRVAVDLVRSRWRERAAAMATGRL